MTQTSLNVSSPRKLNWKAGVIGSLVGGIVFGIMMVASLVGSQSGSVGFVVHIAVSFIFGLTFAIFTGILKWNPITCGILYGAILWILFPFILMPIMMGVSEMAFQITSGNMMSLLGHLVYGLCTGISYKIIDK
jgi:uncharacterized membrane protein YagU involved in acid resistance